MDSNHRSKLQQIYSLSPLATRESAHLSQNNIKLICFTLQLLESWKPMIGLEPITCWLQISCSANWATSAWCVNLSSNDPNDIRTRVTAVKGRCLNRLTMEPCLYHCFSDDRVIYYHSSIRIASVFWKFFYSFFLLLFLHFYSMFLNPKYSVFKSLFHSFQRLWS